MFAPLDGGHCGHRVKMIGRRHDHRIDLLLHLIEHLAKIRELLYIWKFLKRSRRPLRIDVAESDDVIVGSDLADVPLALAAHANSGDVKFFTGWSLATTGHDMPRHDHESGNGGAGGAHELTTGGT